MSSEPEIVAAPAPSASPGPARTPLPSARTIVASVLAIGLLYAGRSFFVPVALAVLLTALLRPVVRWLERRHLRTSVGATLVVVLTIGVVAGTAFGLSVPLQQWGAKLPESIAAAQAKLSRIRQSVQQITKVASQLQNGGPSTAPSAQTAGARTASAQPASPPPPTPPAIGILAKALGTTTSLLMGAVEVLLLTWLMLVSGDLFYEKLLKLMPLPGDRRVTARVVAESERVVAGYMAATALINLGQAVAVGLALSLIGMPDALLWGVACFFLEFIPYLGGTIMVGLLAIVAFTQFQDLGHVLAAPGSYLAITTLQNNVVSPLVYGHRLRLNPVAVLVGVMFWWELWGVAGAILAVPIIAAAKVIGDYLPRVRPLAEFLGD